LFNKFDLILSFSIKRQGWAAEVTPKPSSSTGMACARGENVIRLPLDLTVGRRNAEMCVFLKLHKRH